MPENKLTKTVKYSTFLKDVLISSLGAYGGPEAHFGVFTDQLVVKKKYLSEFELVELMALTTLLPGPSSTQSIIAIGYKIGGPWLGFLTMLVWGLPGILLMTLFSFLGILAFDSNSLFRYIGPMAVGFIFVAAYRLGHKIIQDNLTLSLFLLGAISTYFFKQAWVFPVVMLVGGIASIKFSKEKNLWNRTEIKPPWLYLSLFMFFAVLGIIINLTSNNLIVNLFANFYRYGYLVIGGGQVVIPMMFSELVETNNYLTAAEFLTGYGLVQGIPGPMFSFSAYAGGIAASGGSIFYHILGALISALGLFLPGFLLIYFAYPIWESLKKIKGIKIALKGVSAVAAGLILASGITLLQTNDLTLINLFVTLGTIVLLMTKKIPAPLIVLATLLLGYAI